MLPDAGLVAGVVVGPCATAAVALRMSAAASVAVRSNEVSCGGRPQSVASDRRHATAVQGTRRPVQESGSVRHPTDVNRGLLELLPERLQLAAEVRDFLPQLFDLPLERPDAIRPARPARCGHVR